MSGARWAKIAKYGIDSSQGASKEMIRESPGIQSNSETLRNIETTYDLAQDLTLFKVVGKMRAADFYACLDSYYARGITPLTLWDLTEADLSTITTEEISAFAQYARNLAEACKGGRTAAVFDTLHDFGLGRMFETQLEIVGLPIELHVCLGFDEAKHWLGIDEHMIEASTMSTIYKIGSCIQKTENGKLDRGRSLNLIHELSAAIQCHKNQSILVDLRGAEVQTDMLDLMTFAAECAKYGSDFDKKIAILIPNTAARIETARMFKSCMDIQGFRIRHFINDETAIKWLSDLT